MSEQNQNKKKKISTAELNTLEKNIWMEFLEQASSLELYKSVITSNFDGNSTLLNWIKDNPKVDKATILVAYWMSAPGWFKQFSNREEVLEKSPWSIDGFDFVEEVEEKYCAGFYSESNISFDPKNDVEGYDWTDEYSDIEFVREIPQLMFEPTQGEIEIKGIPRDFDGGLPLEPVDYVQRIYAIFEEYEVE